MPDPEEWRIFVGTLYTIENEIDDCKAAIEAQNFDNYEHFVFEGLKNKQAHDELYQTFMDRSDEFDLMIKVDADMVIEDTDLFKKIVRKFEKNPSLKDLEIAVHDFFTDSLMRGLHAFRDTVTWGGREEDLFVDNSPVGPEEHVVDFEELAPAAVHCKNPSGYQAFHFGVQRGVKLAYPSIEVRNRGPYDYWTGLIRRKLFGMVRDEDRSKESAAEPTDYWATMQRVSEAFADKDDVRRAQALLGFQMALAGKFRPEHLNYDNRKIRGIYANYRDMGMEDLIKKIENYRWVNLRPLADDLRKDLLALLFRLGVRGKVWQN